MLTKLHSTICSTSASPNFRVWGASVNNGIALLTLGWAYVLSASLAERQGLSIKYEPLLETPPASMMLDLRYASLAELRWWKAIVAPGSGWCIAGSQLSPWATVVQNLDIGIGGISECNNPPPTARQAAHYLSRLCDAYDLGPQCSAALAAALTIPLHANMTPLKQAEIELPKSSITTCCKSVKSQTQLPTEFGLIDYYMTLSTCPWVLGPSLWSAFWAPHVPCHRVGVWVQPIIDILDPVIQSNKMELFAKILSFSPMAPLWTGLALCGYTVAIRCILPSLDKLRDYPWFRPSIDAAVWTAVSQSFMDRHLSGPSDSGLVPRADVWQLRHYFADKYPIDVYSHTPPYGWPPFGYMRPEDVELEIRGHLACSHQSRYSHWTWAFNNKIDIGFSSRSMRTHHLDDQCTYPDIEDPGTTVDDELVLRVSRAATEGIFRWCCDQVEQGFGGTIVPRRYGPDRVVEDKERCEPKDAAFIQAWLRAVDHS
ncbi:hypothetical protein F66182_548 [Fusarium sp. NRRL 66182]|nr:hypothetical protein F66182_548 [Fusarium sp. NRRL 66182]